MKFDKITACLDMLGCPNRCKHCWLGSTSNGNLNVNDLRFIAKELRGYTNNLEVFDWYREPDYNDNYKEMWDLTSELSDTKTPHFELLSFWRAVRDDTYVPWLKSHNVNVCQITLFGGEEKTNYFIGRKGAYNEILKTIEILFANKIAPRFQIFVNKNNISDLKSIATLIKTLEMEKRCEEIGTHFSAFVHQGSCDGENKNLYDSWVTSDDIRKIPDLLVEYTLKYTSKSDIYSVFGYTEKELCSKLISDYDVENLANDSPVFYIDKDFNFYPNVTTPSSIWMLGNIKMDGIDRIVENYVNNKSIAQHTRLTVSMSDMVKNVGNFDSLRLFHEDDYKTYLLNSYCYKL